MKTAFTRSKGYIALLIDDQRKPLRDRDVLAAMTLYEGTGCWQLVDVRLSKYGRPNPYAGSLDAETLHASFSPETSEESAFVKSLLREFVEDEDGVIHWCSFEGVVRGHPDVNGYRPKFKTFDWAGYFSQAEGLAKLKEINEFWISYDGDPAKAKIENELRQPTQSEVMSRISMGKLFERERVKRVEALPSLANTAGATYCFWKAATSAMSNANGNGAAVDWHAVEESVVRDSIGKHGQEPDAVLEALLQNSPGVMSWGRREILTKLIASEAVALQAEFAQSRSDHTYASGRGLSPSSASL